MQIAGGIYAKMSRTTLNEVNDDNEASSFPAVQKNYVTNRDYHNLRSRRYSQAHEIGGRFEASPP